MGHRFVYVLNIRRFQRIIMQFVNLFFFAYYLPENSDKHLEHLNNLITLVFHCVPSRCQCASLWPCMPAIWEVFLSIRQTL